MLRHKIDLYGGLSIYGNKHDFQEFEKYLYFGINLEFPFIAPKAIEKAKYEISKINLDKTNLINKKFSEKLYTHLKNLYEFIGYEKKMIEICKEKIILAEAIVIDENKNYSFGKVTLKDLIDEVNNLEDSKFQMITHEIELKKLIVEWMNLTDTLIKEDTNITEAIKVKYHNLSDI